MHALTLKFCNGCAFVDGNDICLVHMLSRTAKIVNVRGIVWLFKRVYICMNFFENTLKTRGPRVNMNKYISVYVGQSKNIMKKISHFNPMLR